MVGPPKYLVWGNMITLLFCEELNIFRIQNVFQPEKATVKTEEQLKTAGVADYIIIDAKAHPDEKRVIGY